MARKSAILFSMVIAAGVLSGCSESASVVNPADDLSAELQEAVLQSDQLTEAMVQAELRGMGVVTRSPGIGSGMVTNTITFSRTRTCPAGGELSVEGSIVRTADFSTGVMEAEMSGSRTATDCAFRIGERTITINGSSMWEKFRRRVDGKPDGPQTSHYSGSWVAVASTGEERSCSFDYSVVRDPETLTLTVEGTLCRNPLRRWLSWNPNADG